MDNGDRNAAWQDLLDADYNARYWAKVARHFHHRQKSAHIILTVLTSGAVVGWLAGLAHALNFSISSAASFAASVVLPLLKWSEIATQSQAERKAWEFILAEYNSLWQRLNAEDEPDQNETKKNIDRLRKKCAKQAGGKNVLPHIWWLEKKARREVCTYWNIEDTAPPDFWDRLFKRAPATEGTQN